MATSQQHIIGRCKVQVDLPSRREQDYLFELISHLSQEKIPKILSSVFDRLIARDKYVQIEKIVLQLGQISVENFERLFLEKLETELTLILGTLKKAASQETPIPKHLVLTEAEQNWESLSTFLDKGRFSWRDGSTTKNIEQLIQVVLTDHEGSSITKWDEVLGYPNALKRLYQQASTSTLWQINQKLVVTRYPWVQSFRKEVNASLKYHNLTDKEDLKKIVEYSILQLAFKYNFVPSRFKRSIPFYQQFLFIIALELSVPLPVLAIHLLTVIDENAIQVHLRFRQSLRKIAKQRIPVKLEITASAFISEIKKDGAWISPSSAIFEIALIEKKIGFKKALLSLLAKEEVLIRMTKLPLLFLKQCILVLGGGKLEKLTRELQRFIRSSKEFSKLQKTDLERRLYLFLLQETVKRKGRIPSLSSAKRNIVKKGLLIEQIEEDIAERPIIFQQNFLERLAYFLEKGVLLRQPSQRGLNEVEDQLSLLMDQQEELIISALRDILRRKEVLDRLIQQFSPATHQAILIAFVGPDCQRLLQSISLLSELYFATIDIRNSLYPRLVELALRQAIHVDRSFNFKSWTTSCFALMSDVSKLEIDEIKSRFLIASSSLPVDSLGRKTLWPHLLLGRYSGLRSPEYLKKLLRKPRAETVDALELATLQKQLEEEVENENLKLSLKEETRKVLKNFPNEGNLGKLIGQENLRLLLQIIDPARWPIVLTIVQDMQVLNWGEEDAKQLELISLSVLFELLMEEHFSFGLFWDNWKKRLATHRQWPLNKVEQTYQEKKRDKALLSLMEGPLQEILSVEENAEVQERIDVNAVWSERQDLLFGFLSSGRFPAHAKRLSINEMEAEIRNLLEEHLSTFKEYCQSLASNINLASRIADQFSLSTQKNILIGMYVNSGPNAEELLQIERICMEAAPSIPPPYFWKKIFDWGMRRIGETWDSTLLLQYLVEEMERDYNVEAKKTKETWKQVIQKDRLYPALAKSIETILSVLSVSEELELEQWQKAYKVPNKDYTKYLITDAFEPRWVQSQMDRLRARLQSPEKIQWWDNTAETVDVILRPFGKYEPAILIRFLLEAWSTQEQEIVRQWPLKTARQLLQHQLKDISFFVENSLNIVREALDKQNSIRLKRLTWKVAHWVLANQLEFSTQQYLEAFLRIIKSVYQQPNYELIKKLQRTAEYRFFQEGISYQRLYEWLQELPLSYKIVTERDGKAKKVVSPPKVDKAVQGANYVEDLKADLANLTYYLQYGSFPSVESGWSRSVLIQKIGVVLARHPQQLRMLIASTCQEEKQATRLLGLLGNDQKRRLLPLLLTKHTTDVFFYWDELRLFTKEVGLLKEEEVTEVLYAHILVFLAKLGRRSFQSLDYYKKVTVFMMDKSNTNYWSWKQKLQQFQSSTHKRFPILQQTIQSISVDVEEQKETKKTNDMDTIDDYIYINNAGLIILSAFLPRYFTTLEMLEDKQFKSDEAAKRAVLLLQYLATKQTETPEHLLVFNKILCGLSIHDPVPFSIELTDSEKELSQFLLNSVLQNWEMMKNSSIENFCGAFLLREGRLIEENKRWTLHVEHKPYDMVLEHLPWTISMINLPWMNKRIDVEWRTQP